MHDSLFLDAHVIRPYVWRRSNFSPYLSRLGPSSSSCGATTIGSYLLMIRIPRAQHMLAHLNPTASPRLCSSWLSMTSRHIRCSLRHTHPATTTVGWLHFSLHIFLEVLFMNHAFSSFLFFFFRHKLLLPNRVVQCPADAEQAGRYCVCRTVFHG